MGYLGTPPQSGFISNASNQYFTGITQNYIDLNQSIDSLSSVIILVNGVVQENADLTLTSSTRITLGQTTVASDKITCVYLGKITSNQAPATGSVTNDMLAGSIANAKLANSSITLNGSAVSLGGSATISSNAGTEIVYADRSGNQTLSDNTWTKIEYNTEQYDPDSNWDTTNDRYIAPSAGRYYFTATAYLWGSLQNVHSQFYLNGSNVGDTYFIINYNASNTTHECSVRSNAILNLSASDYVEFYAKSDVHSGSVTVDQLGTQFLAFRLD